jgi:hypothetical protein
VEGGEEVKCYCLEGDSFSFFCLLAPLDSASDIYHDIGIFSFHFAAIIVFLWPNGVLFNNL